MQETLLSDSIRHVDGDKLKFRYLNVVLFHNFCKFAVSNRVLTKKQFNYKTDSINKALRKSPV